MLKNRNSRVRRYVVLGLKIGIFLFFITTFFRVGDMYTYENDECYPGFTVDSGRGDDLNRVTTYMGWPIYVGISKYCSKFPYEGKMIEIKILPVGLISNVVFYSFVSASVLYAFGESDRRIISNKNKSKYAKAYAELRGKADD